MKLYFVQLTNGPFYGMHEQAVVRAWDAETAVELVRATYHDSLLVLEFVAFELATDGPAKVLFVGTERG